ncbi:hypothetical protein D3C72_2165530 [compost metagenome]
MCIAFGRPCEEPLRRIVGAQNPDGIIGDVPAEPPIGEQRVADHEEQAAEGRRSRGGFLQCSNRQLSVTGNGLRGHGSQRQRIDDNGNAHG